MISKISTTDAHRFVLLVPDLSPLVTAHQISVQTLLDFITTPGQVLNNHKIQFVTESDGYKIQ